MLSGYALNITGLCLDINMRLYKLGGLPHLIVVETETESVVKAEGVAADVGCALSVVVWCRGRAVSTCALRVRMEVECRRRVSAESAAPPPASAICTPTRQPRVAWLRPNAPNNRIESPRSRGILLVPFLHKKHTYRSTYT